MCALVMLAPLFFGLRALTNFWGTAATQTKARGGRRALQKATARRQKLVRFPESPDASVAYGRLTGEWAAG